MSVGQMKTHIANYEQKKLIKKLLTHNPNVAVFTI